MGVCNRHIIIGMLSAAMCLLPGGNVHAQAEAAADVQNVFAYFRNISSFDRNFPREKVLLHLDNNAYMQGETIWFKAYVLRASSLLPTTLSGVLYVELLNPDGQLVERKMLKVKDGEANGEFTLTPGVKSGFYEVRAFTREMLNWGGEACYSRVVPIFKKPSREGDFSQLDIFRPKGKWNLMPQAPRYYDFSSKSSAQIDFYPEGGNIVGGLQANIAYKLSNGRGHALESRCSLYDAAGNLIETFLPEHLGMGTFALPPTAQGGYVTVEGYDQKFALPATQAEGAAMVVVPDGDSAKVIVQTTSGLAGKLMGLSVTCRDMACYFDTLRAGKGKEAIEIVLPQSALREGVNRIDIFADNGQGLCRRLVYKRGKRIGLKLDIKQNRASYSPFAPVVLDMNLAAPEGVKKGRFSISVRDAEGELTGQPTPGFDTECLLSSEVKGYIANPEFYFEADDSLHRRALDLLLLVQGWSANDISTMNATRQFVLMQPIEERLTLNGRVLQDNNREKPMAGVSLSLKMISMQGGSLSSKATTDKQGRFAFDSEVDYTGQWLGQLTTKDGDKRKFSRVTFDRWFAPKTRPYAPDETILREPKVPKEIVVANADTFQWKDTLPPIKTVVLPTANIIKENKYRGLVGNRYNYLGGSKAGEARANITYNIEIETERYKDAGGGTRLIWDWLQDNNDKFTYDIHEPGGQHYRVQKDIGAQQDRFYTYSAGDTHRQGTNHFVNYNFYYKGRPCVVFFDNVLFGGAVSDNLFMEDVKSISIVENPEDWRGFIPANMLGENQTAIENSNAAAIFLYTRPNNAFFDTKKGIDKRLIWGYSEPRNFYSPNYRVYDMPSAKDLRRTLYWNPSVETDADGHASIVLFGNARPDMKIRVSARGITGDGRLIDGDR